MASRKPFVRAVLLGVYLAAPTASPAQTIFAALGGKVTDEQGALLPGVTVTLRQVETNTTRTDTTEANGQYFVPNLPAGRYELTWRSRGSPRPGASWCSAWARTPRWTSP